MKLYNVTWKTNTAGPSPDFNNRTEIFLFGCKRAQEGKACANCFNNDLWDASKVAEEYTPKELAYKIFLNAPNKYITIGGGEPIDQIDELIMLCKELKNYGFNIMIYTWRQLLKVFKNNFESIELPYISKYKDNIDLGFKQLLKYVDIIVDGQFVQSEKLYDEQAGDGTFSSIGSGNQIVWDVSDLNHIKGESLSEIEYLTINPKNNKLYFIKKR